MKWLEIFLFDIILSISIIIAIGILSKVYESKVKARVTADFSLRTSEAYTQDGAEWIPAVAATRNDMWLIKQGEAKAAIARLRKKITPDREAQSDETRNGNEST